MAEVLNELLPEIEKVLTRGGSVKRLSVSLRFPNCLNNINVKNEDSVADFATFAQSTATSIVMQNKMGLV
jgi:hypothetical protein